MKAVLFLAGLALPILQSGGSSPDLPEPRSASDLRVLVVGGGPDPRDNQVAIESNVRYFDRLLDPGVGRRILFANGDATDKTVQYEDDSGTTRYRAPQLRQMDGPSRLASVQKEFDGLTRQVEGDPGSRVLLYFTGHGSSNVESEYTNNRFDLWGDDELSVKRLAAYLDELPRKTPVTVVMVQCFSGAFGNLIFQDGDPTEDLSDRPICGFFAAIAPRMAAGCTPSIDEADYQDFTGYFFGALTGVDRLGHRISGADYNHDGRVTMDEAYAYALIHDDSIDTPTCSSDTFLRRFVKATEEKTFATRWSMVRSWATQAQGAALDALSKDLELSGEDRPKVAYDKFQRIDK